MNKNLLLIIVGVSIILIGFLFLSNDSKFENKDDEEIKSIPKIVPQKKKEEKPVSEIEHEPKREEKNEKPAIIEEKPKAFKERGDANKTSVRASDPLKTGFKERWAEIGESEEYYLAEYTNKKFRNPLPGPKKVQAIEKSISWKLKFNASVCGAPVVKGDSIYVNTYDKQIFEIDANQGNLKRKTKVWYQPIGNMKLYKNNLIVPQRNGNVSSVRTTDFKRIWNHRTAVSKPAGEIDISIMDAVVFSDKIYLSKHWGNLYILSAPKGKMLFDPGVPYESRINLPAVKWGDKVIYCNIGGELLCFSLDGKGRHFKTEIPRGYPISMLVYNDWLLIATTEYELLGINLLDRKVKWTQPLDGHAFNALRMIKGKIYVNAKSISCRELKTGKVIWKEGSTEKRGFCRGPVFQINDNIYAISQSGEMIGLTIHGKVFLRKKIVNNGEVWNHLTGNKTHLFISNNQKEMIAVRI